MKSAWLALLAGCPLALGACGAPEDPDDVVETHRAAITVACAAGPAGSICADYTDDSGLLTVRSKTCPALPAATGIQVATCLHEPGFAGIGGGGNVVGLPVPGALMTGSLLPTEGTPRWEVRFKTHGSSSSYQVQAYAIGLKVAGLTQAQLESQLILVTSTSSLSTDPLTTAIMPAGYTMIGGGGYVDTGPDGGYGMLLKGSFPLNTNRWRVFGSDHLQTDYGYAYAMAIGIKTCLSNGICLANNITSGSGGDVATGYSEIAMFPGVGRVETGVGAYSSDDGVGRFLTHVIPYSNGALPGPQGLVVRSKDRSLVSAGSLKGWMISLIPQ